MNRSLRFCCLVVLALACQIGVNSANADAPADERSIRVQLVSPTRLECKDFPLLETIDYLADFHDTPMSFDLAEIKRIGIDLGPSTVTKKTTGRLDDTLTEILGPFNLSFMICPCAPRARCSVASRLYR